MSRRGASLAQGHAGRGGQAPPVALGAARVFRLPIDHRNLWALARGSLTHLWAVEETLSKALADVDM